MSYENEQEMNFRDVLGLGEKEKHPGVSVQWDAEKGQKSIKVPSPLHRKLKILAFWAESTHSLDNPTIGGIIGDALDFYLENKHAEALTFINNSL